jgi:hypothetical protein
VPTDDVCVSETLAGIPHDAAKKGQLPRKRIAATITILRRLLVPIPTDLRGLRAIARSCWSALPAGSAAQNSLPFACHYGRTGPCTVRTLTC